MKTTSEKRETKNKLPKKRSNVNYEVIFKTQDYRSTLKLRFDKNNISEDDLDRIMACS